MKRSIALLIIAITIAQQYAYAAETTETAIIRCKDLSMLQESGKNGFLDIQSDGSNSIDIPSGFLLPGASECYVENYGTSYPSYTCSWRKFQDASSAEAFKSTLEEEISGCIPKGAKKRSRSRKNGPNEHNAVYYSFDDYQPTISIDHITYHDLDRDTVRFKFEMELSANQ